MEDFVERRKVRHEQEREDFVLHGLGNRGSSYLNYLGSPYVTSWQYISTVAAYFSMEEQSFPFPIQAYHAPQISKQAL